jgi:hypothetical protein
MRKSRPEHSRTACTPFQYLATFSLLEYLGISNEYPPGNGKRYFRTNTILIIYLDVNISKSMTSLHCVIYNGIKNMSTWNILLLFHAECITKCSVKDPNLQNEIMKENLQICLSWRNKMSKCYGNWWYLKRGVIRQLAAIC